ncbi:MAG: phosphoadenylyl-sulfate reductase [Flavobacteriaceae bacterium]|nr:phosphoadenylyl-sulfate reductase [Flavobacteriaceae bacterium]
MTIIEIHQQLKKYQVENRKVLVTSSFQTHSIPLLHILSTSEVEVEVLFINTGFHFAETVSFKDEVSELLNLKVIDVRSQVPKSLQKDEEGHFYFASDTDYCCFLNKTQPLEPFLMQNDVWISGVRSEQSSERKNMKTEQESPFNTLRFHPLLDWTSKQIYEYRMRYNLPEHPLDKEGYQSIGCAPCTRKFDANDERSARWFGQNKTECGLHKNLIK